MNGADRVLAACLWALGVALTAALVHLLAVFALPRFIGEPPLQRLAPYLKAGEMTLLPRAAPSSQWAPFVDPAAAQGACLFDLTRTPVRVFGEIDADRLMTLSFRTPAGEIFYSMSDRAAQRGAIDVLILTNEQLEALEADSDDEEPVQELRLVAPSTTGFVLVNALAAFPSQRRDAESLIQAMSCKPEERAAE